jgi:hypothetical protein
VPPKQASDQKGRDVRNKNRRELGGVRRDASGEDERDGDRQAGYSKCNRDDVGPAKRRPERGVARPALQVQGLEVEVATDSRASQETALLHPSPVRRASSASTKQTQCA